MTARIPPESVKINMQLDDNVHSKNLHIRKNVVKRRQMDTLGRKNTLVQNCR